MKTYLNARIIKYELIAALGPTTLDTSTLRVTWGRGTARDWLTIELIVKSENEARYQTDCIEEVVKASADRWGVGNHYSDDGRVVGARLYVYINCRNEKRRLYFV